MAKVISPFKISGTIGDLTFKNGPSGNIAQLKPGPSRETVLESDRFDKTRRNAGEFKRAISDATLLRRALGEAIDGVRTSFLNGHMNKLLHTLVKTDLQHDYGFRQAAAGDIDLLEGFEFNPQLSLENTLPVSYQCSLNAAKGIMRVDIPVFLLRRKKAFPKGATHFRIVSCGVMVDLDRGVYARQIKTSALLPMSRKTPEPISLEHQLYGTPGQILLQAMGIQFFQVVNGKEVLLKGGAVRIVQVIQRERIPQNRPVAAIQTEEKAKPYTAKDLHGMLRMGTQQIPLPDLPIPDKGICLSGRYDPFTPLPPDLPD